MPNAKRRPFTRAAARRRSSRSIAPVNRSAAEETTPRKRSSSARSSDASPSGKRVRVHSGSDDDDNSRHGGDDAEVQPPPVQHGDDHEQEGEPSADEAELQVGAPANSDSDDDNLLMVYQKKETRNDDEDGDESDKASEEREATSTPVEHVQSGPMTGSTKRKASVRAAERLAKALKSPSPEESSPSPAPGGTRATGDIACPVCALACNTKLKLSQHMHEEHPNLYPFQCDKCPSSFNAANKLAEHDRRVHQKLKRFACDQCPAMFYDKTELKHHMRAHITVRAFACPEANCSMTFKTDEHLRSHMTRRHMERAFGCDECTRRFTEDRQLQQHVAKVHAAGALCFTCPDCGHAYHMEKVLGQHMVMVHSKTLDGIVLNKVAPRSAAAAAVDTAPNGHSHPVGEMESSDRDNTMDSDSLQSISMAAAAPSAVHNLFFGTGAAPAIETQAQSDPDDDDDDDNPGLTIKDELNDEAYAEPQSNVSQGKQTQVNRYGCPECERSYTSVDSLRVHVRSVHRGISRYQCDQCTKRFNTAYQLGKHVRHVHRSGQEALVCDVCGVALPSQRALQLHFVKVHAQTIDGICINKVESAEGGADDTGALAAGDSDADAPLPTMAPVAQPAAPAVDHDAHDSGALQLQRPATPPHKVHFAPMPSSAPRRRYQCNNCTRQFSDAADFAKHERAVHSADGGKVAQWCNDCGAAFPSKSALAKHSLADHHKTMDGIHVNVISPRHSAAAASALSAAAAGANGGKAGAQYTCPECHRPYGSIKSLSMHVLSVHRDVRRYSCSECSRRFSTAYQLGQHVRQVHTEGSPCHRCEECDAAFPSRNALCKHMLYAHQRTIEGISVTMGFGLDNKKVSKSQAAAEAAGDGAQLGLSQVKSAVKTESAGGATLRFSCHTCPRRFAHAYQLDSHVKTVHGGAITAAAAAAATAAAMRAVVKSPSAAQSNLAHIESRRRFACASCPRTFNHTYKLAEHQRRVHAETAATGGPLCCEQCGAAYPTRSTLVTHMARAHGIHKAHAGAHASQVVATAAPAAQPRAAAANSGTSSSCVMPALSQALAQFARSPHDKADVRPQKRRIASRMPATHVDRSDGHAAQSSPGSAAEARSESSAVSSSASSAQPSGTAVCIECPPCGMTFECKDDYRTHFMAVHMGGILGSKTKGRPCDVCKKVFTSTAQLRAHERSAHQEEKEAEQQQTGDTVAEQQDTAQEAPADDEPASKPHVKAEPVADSDEPVAAAAVAAEAPPQEDTKPPQCNEHPAATKTATKTINIAKVDDGYKCVYCDRVFADVNAAVAHQMAEHLAGVF